MLRLIKLATFSTLAMIVLTSANQSASAQTTVLFDTSLGDIQVELFDATAPTTVANFLSYVNAAPGSNYDNTLIHRSVDNFVVQGGGFTLPTPGGGAPSGIPTMPPIVNEFGASNLRGTIAMARLGGQPNSATNQWFFNVADNDFLDGVDGGFTVFGEVTIGLDVVDNINALNIFNFNGAGGGPFGEVPLINGTDFVALNSVTVVPTVVPEPGSMAVLMFCATGIAAIRRRKLS